VKVKEKSFLWFLTFPFAHKGRTLIGDTIYYSKDTYPSEKSIAHEEIHLRQKKEVGSLKFHLLYLFALPFLYNPFRYKWEMEAFTKGSGISADDAKRLLKGPSYGWLLYNK
jgi:hypothetical protein